MSARLAQDGEHRIINPENASSVLGLGVIFCITVDLRQCPFTFHLPSFGISSRSLAGKLVFTVELCSHTG
jgi:hypothetical protein